MRRAARSRARRARRGSGTARGSAGRSRSPSPAPRRRRSRWRRSPRPPARRRTHVGAAVDLDVEHVHLAVHRPDLASRVDMHGGVRQLLLTRHALERSTRPRGPPRSSRAVSRAHEIAGPSSVCAPARSCSSEPITVHFSGSTINRAPSAAAARVRRSAAARFAAVSAVEFSWTAATFMSRSPSTGDPPAE